jgi:hypothetical protein
MPAFLTHGRFPDRLRGILNILVELAPDVDMKDMSIRSRVTQDRRRLSRFPVIADCRFTYEGKTYPAVILDLSMNGGFLSARFLPPKGVSLILSIKSSEIKEPVTLYARVARVGWCTSDHGTLSRFGVNFQHPSTEIITLLRTLRSRCDLKARTAAHRVAGTP